MNETVLQSAIRKLEWGRHQRDWSVDISGPECIALLEELERLQAIEAVAGIEVCA